MPNEFLTTTAWALEPGTMEIVDEILTARFNGESRDLAAIEARLGRPMENNRPEKPYAIEDGVAVIEMNGVMGKRMGMMHRMSGGASTEYMQMALEEALTDPAVEAVVLKVDSPGGTVDGSFELADFAAKNRGIKPVFGYVDGMAASAAYLLMAAACDQIFSYRTSLSGNVGAKIMHYDRSGADKQAGVTRTIIASGEYKAMANDTEPLSAKGEAYLQDQVDTYYAMFIDAVAVGRGITPEEAQAKFGDGAVHIAEQALAIGMIDQIGSLAETINAARAAAMEEKEMNKAEILAKFPELAAELMADGASQATEEFEGQVTEQADQAVADERQRSCELYSAIHGEEAGKAYGEMIANGLTASQYQAVASTVTGKQEESGSTADQQILDSLENGDDLELSGGGNGGGPADFMAAVDGHMAEKNVGKIDAMKAMAKAHPELHQAFKNG